MKCYYTKKEGLEKLINYLRERGIRPVPAGKVWSTGPVSWYTDWNRFRESAAALHEESFLVLNGLAGTEHHLTYAFLLKLSGRLSYIHIDAHADCAPSPSEHYFYFDSASFVRALLQDFMNIEEAIMLGTTKGLENDNVLEAGVVHKIRIYSPQDCAFVTKRSEKRTEWQRLSDWDPTSIKTDRIYLSIDLDVLENVSFAKLVKLVRGLGDRQIVGADLCNIGYLTSQKFYTLYQTLEQVVGQR